MNCKMYLNDLVRVKLLDEGVLYGKLIWSEVHNTYAIIQWEGNFVYFREDCVAEISHYDELTAERIWKLSEATVSVLDNISDMTSEVVDMCDKVGKEYCMSVGQKLARENKEVLMDE